MFTRELCRKIGSELEEAAAVIAAKHGLKKAAHLTVQFLSIGWNFSMRTKKQDTEKQTFRRMAPLYGLHPDWFGAEVAIYGDRYRVVGIKPKLPKYPVLIEKDGKKFKASAADIIRAMT